MVFCKFLEIIWDIFGDNFLSYIRREKCPNTELFLVYIFLYSNQKKFRIWTLFTVKTCLKTYHTKSSYTQKQPSRGVLKKRCSETMQQIYRRTPDHKVLILWSGRKNNLIRKTRLISKFITTQPGWQTTTIPILANISRSKDNRAMEFSQLIEYDKRNIFL